MQTYEGIIIDFPLAVEVNEPSSETGFSVQAQGTGSFSGLSYTIPAHTNGSLKATIQVMAITSENVKELNDLVMSMLNASAKEEIKKHSEVEAKGSADLSLWSFFGWGAHGSAGYKETNDKMTSKGLTEEQMSTIINKLFDIASSMTHVELDFKIYNKDNDYDVSGDLQLYTISGTISTSKGTKQYRFLANKGTAGDKGAGETANAEGSVIPLS